MEQNNITYRDIFREKEYRKLLLSNIINRFGDSVDALAFTWLVYQITHSAAWSAIVFALNTIPNVAVQPFAGAIVEKMNKKKVLVFTHLLRAVIITGFALMYKFGMVNALVMAAFTLIITTVESFNLPASSAFTLQVMKKEHLTSGMSLSSMLSSAATLVGTGAAGVIIAAWGIPVAMFIDVATFFISALLIWMIKTKMDVISETNEEAEPKEKAEDEEGFWDRFKAGIAYVGKTPVVRNFCLLCVFLNFMLVPVNALQAPIASEIFKAGGEILSFVGVFAAVGGILGSALVPVLSKKLSPLGITCLGIGMLGLGLIGVGFGGIFSGKAIYAYAAASVYFFIMMIAASLVGGIIGIQFMKSVDSKYIARASAVFNASATAAMPIGSLLVSALVAFIPTAKILIFSAIFAAVILIVTAITKPRLESKEELKDAA